MFLCVWFDACICNLYVNMSPLLCVASQYFVSEPYLKTSHFVQMWNIHLPFHGLKRLLHWVSAGRDSQWRPSQRHRRGSAAAIEHLNVTIIKLISVMLFLQSAAVWGLIFILRGWHPGLCCFSSLSCLATETALQFRADETWRGFTNYHCLTASTTPPAIWYILCQTIGH